MCANAREPEERTPLLNISLRSRRRRTAVGGVVLALALGSLVAALPAQASAGSSATSAPAGGTVSSRAVAISTPTPPTIQVTPVVTDSLNPGGVTAPDAILTCATSQLTIDDTNNLVIPVGCLKLYNGEWIKVAWTYISGYTELTQQTDGNLVLTVSNGTTTPTTPWSSDTTFKGNTNGPGCLAQFQTNADLVVSNCDGTLIWDSATHTYPDAVLAFELYGDLVIYENSAGTALWSTNT